MNLFSWFGRSKAASPSLANEPAKPPRAAPDMASWTTEEIGVAALLQLGVIVEVLNRHGYGHEAESLVAAPTLAARKLLASKRAVIETTGSDNATDMGYAS